MSQQIADLTINLSADTAEFGQQMGRVERQLQETAEKAEASQRRMAQLLEQQAQSARSSVESTAQSLQELNNQQEISQQQRADYYQRIAQEEARAAIESRKQADAFLEQSQSVGQTRDALKQLTEVLNKSTKAYDKLKITGEQFAEIQNVTKSRIKAIQDQQDANTEKYYKQIEAVKGLSGSASALRAIQAQLNQEVKKGTIHQRDYQVLISAITSESMKLRREEESLTQQKTWFIQQIKEQVATQNLSREQMLRYQASQLGVSSSAEIYIRRLSESNKETKEFDKNSKSLSGRLQSIANSFNMGSLVRGGIWGGITAGLTGVAKLAYDAEREFSQFNKQLILTGNYANKSASQLNEMARTLAGGGITRGEMATSISSVVGTGVFSNNEISRVSKAAAQMNYITGQAIDTTIDQFKRLQDEPLQMSLELEKANHHLTASQLEQIRTLELQGNKTEAARLAIDVYAQAINDGANDIVENLGYLESAWLGIKNTAKKGWDAMLNIGRTETLNDQIREQESLLKSLSNIVITPQYRLDEIKVKIATLKEQVSDIDLKNAQKQAEVVANQLEVNQIRLQEKWRSFYSWETQRLKKLAELEKEKHALTKEQYEEAKAMINYRLRDRQIPRRGRENGNRVSAGKREEENASRDLLALQAQLDVLRKHHNTYQQISQQRKDLQKQQAQFTLLEQASQSRQLTVTEKSLLAHKDNILTQKEKLALIGDEIVLQQRLNKMQAQAEKYLTQQIKKRQAIEANAGLSRQEIQRNNQREQLLIDNKDNPQLSMMVAEQQKTFEAEDNQRNNWLAGAKSAWADYCETALDVNTQVKNATSMALDGFSSQLTDVLVEREADFKAFTKSIFKMITNILVKMALIKGLEAFGFGGFSAPVANAKGGVYSSSSLSRYSGHIVNRPTLFAFAKGAGVMGEAGPEGIFPLRRGIDGKLGVVAKIPNQGAGFTQINNVTIQNESSQGQISPHVLKKIYEISKRGAQDYILSQRRDGGGM